MKIMIVKPPSHFGTIRMDRLIRCEPLELEYIYTTLKEYDTRIVDCSQRRENPVKYACSFRPDIILFTSYIIHCTIVLNYSEKIKKQLPNVRIFVGGVHAEVCPEHFDSPFVDGVFFANQLSALAEVVQSILKDMSYKEVPGLALRNGNAFVKNAPAFFNPSTMVKPGRVLFNRHPERYTYLYYNKCASVKTAFGCTGRCTFCFCREMNQGTYTPRSIEDVVDEIASIDAESILLLDDNFLIDTQRLHTFADLVTSRGIHKKFIAYGTASFVAKNETLISKLKSAGLDALIIGLEYVDDSELKHAAKISTVQDNDRTIQILLENEIDLFALFIVNPQWRHENFRKLARYVKSRSIRFATFSTSTVFPNTGDYRRLSPCKDADHNWWRYDLLRLHEKPKHMSPLQYYLWMYYLYMLPGLHPATFGWMIRRCGMIKSLKIIGVSALIGAEYLLKILIWR